MAVLGRVTQLWVFPVKSMTGAAVDVADVDLGGLVGDRSWAVVDADGETVTAKREPRLREVTTRLLDGDLRLDVPGAAPGLAPEAAAAALSAWLGTPLALAHREGPGFVDVSPVHLVSTSSLADAAHAEDCDSCDIAAPRANLVLELDPAGESAAPAGALGPEQAWVGRSLQVGSSTLAVVRLPKHCLGAYADVATPGRVAVGDAVVLS